MLALPNGKTRLGNDKKDNRFGSANDEGHTSPPSHSFFSSFSLLSTLYIFNEQQWDKYT